MGNLLHTVSLVAQKTHRKNIIAYNTGKHKISAHQAVHERIENAEKSI